MINLDLFLLIQQINHISKTGNSSWKLKIIVLPQIDSSHQASSCLAAKSPTESILCTFWKIEARISKTYK